METPAKPDQHLGARTTIRTYVIVDEYNTTFVKAYGWEHARSLHYTRQLRDMGASNDVAAEIISIAEVPSTFLHRMDVPNETTSLSMARPPGNWEDPHCRGCGIIFRSPHCRKDEIPAFNRSTSEG